MVNLTCVGLRVGRQGMFKKFSFAVTCFYSLENGGVLIKLKQMMSK